jgi:hypothetical protein
MTTLTSKLRKQFTIRPVVLAACAFVLAVTYLVPATGAGNSAGHGVYMVCDDFENLSVENPHDNAAPAERP